MARYRYLLGDSRGEAARLRFQAKLWDPVSFALFDRAPCVLDCVARKPRP